MAPSSSNIPGREETEAQLHRILQSRDFRNSPRACDFLRYVVKESLDGRGAIIDQFTIGTNALGRRGDFSPNEDPAVRMQATRLRQSLEHYYLTEGLEDPVVIKLPKGTYVPKFDVNGNTAAALAPLGADSSPVLLVGQFQNHTESESVEFIAQGLGSDLAVALDRYRTSRVILLPGQAEDDKKVLDQARHACGEACCYLLRGHLGMHSGSLRVTLWVEEVSGGVICWSHEEQCAIDSEERSRFLDDFVERVTASIAEEQGVVAQQAIVRMNGNSPLVANAYEALLHLYHAERCASLENYERALLALRHAVKVAPEDGRLWSGLARVHTLNYMLEMLPELQISMEETIEYAKKGVRLNAEDQRAWCIFAFAHTIAGNLKEGREATLTAIAQNPDSTFFRDVIGYLFILQGDWERGVAISREAVRINPFVRETVFAGLWLAAFNSGDFEEAYAWAERYHEQAIFWSPLMRAAALARLDRLPEAGAAIEHLLLLRPDFPKIGSRLIRKCIKDEQIALRVEEALELAGLQFAPASGDQPASRCGVDD